MDDNSKQNIDLKKTRKSCGNDESNNNGEQCK